MWFIRGEYINFLTNIKNYVFASVEEKGKKTFKLGNVISNPKMLNLPKAFLMPEKLKNNVQLTIYDRSFTENHREFVKFYLLSKDGFNDNIKCIVESHDMSKNLTFLVRYVTNIIHNSCDYDPSFMERLNKTLTEIGK